MKTILTAIALVTATSFAAQADTLRCTASTWSHAVNAISSSVPQHERLDIVKSWIPETFRITDNKTTSFGRNVDGTSAKVSTTFNGYKIIRSTTDSRGRRHSVQYTITAPEGENRATVTMSQPGFKALGPVFYKCRSY